jgi:iron complex transport system ATP-binding protein
LAPVSPALELVGAVVRLRGREVLNGVDFSVEPGEVVGVIGPNGAGKTTLMRATLGLARLSAGEARLGGEAVASLSPARRAALAAYLPQARPVGWNVPAWRLAALGQPRLAPAAARPKALEALEALGVAALAERGVLDMSGGERLRVLLARLICAGAPLLVADEPAAGLDPDGQWAVMEMFRARAAAGAAVVVSLHDLTLTARTCDRIAVMHAGRLEALGSPAAVLTPRVLADVFRIEGMRVETALGPVVASRPLDRI